MNEAVVAQVDGHVVDPAALDVEEDQVAGLEVLACYLDAVALGHGIGSTWQVDVLDIVEGILDQAAAVEALGRRAATPAIWRAEHVDGAAEHSAALLGRCRGNRQVARLGRIGRACALADLFHRCALHRGADAIAGETVGKTLLTVGGVGGQGQ